MTTIRSLADLGTLRDRLIEQPKPQTKPQAPIVTRDEDFDEYAEISAIFDAQEAEMVHDMLMREPNGARVYLGPRFQPPVRRGTGRTKRWAVH